jgi:predicted AAA+ superfamily ATPase
MIRHNDYFERGFRFFYWRDKGGLEVDLIVARSHSTPVAAIELKSSADPTTDDLAGLKAFGEEYPKVPRYCFSQTPRPYELSDGIFVLPWREGLALMKSFGKD